MASEKIFGLPGAALDPESLRSGRTVVCEFLDGHRRAEIIGQRPLWNKATEKNPAGYYVRVRFVDKQWGICNVCLDTMHEEAVTDVEAAAYDSRQPVTVEAKPAAALSHAERCAATHCLLQTFPDTPHHRELVKCCLGQKWSELPNWASQRQPSSESVAVVRPTSRAPPTFEVVLAKKGHTVVGCACLAFAYRDEAAAGDRPWCCEVIFMAVREDHRARRIGQQLLREAVARCARARAERFVVLSCAPADSTNWFLDAGGGRLRGALVATSARQFGQQLSQFSALRAACVVPSSFWMHWPFAQDDADGVTLLWMTLQQCENWLHRSSARARDDDGSSDRKRKLAKI